MITFGQMPDRLEAAGLTKLTHQRCRQLAEEDPNWPIPMDEAVKVGRMRLFDWHVLEPYFRNRKSRQGQHSDRQPATEGETVAEMTAYQDLMTALGARRPDQSADDDEKIVLGALAKYAHELAEKIRAWVADPMSDSGASEYGDRGNVLEAADLIEPQSDEESST